MRTLFFFNNSNSLHLYRGVSAVWFKVGSVLAVIKCLCKLSADAFHILGWHACIVGLVFILSFVLCLSRQPVKGYLSNPFLFCFSASSKVITFYNKDTRGELQKVTFDNEKVKRIFHGSFHKVDAILSSDCLTVIYMRKKVTIFQIKYAINF